MVLDAITQVQLFVSVFTLVYTLTLVLYVLASWLRLPPALNSVHRFLHDVCDPYLRLWRRLLPLTVGPMDFSPMIAILAVYFAGRLVNFALDQLH